PPSLAWALLVPYTTLFRSRCRQLICDLGGPASEFRFSRFDALLFPVANFNFDLFKMRRPRIDLLQHFRSSCVVLKSRHGRDVRFLARQTFKLLLLTRCLLLRPAARRVASNCF